MGEEKITDPTYLLREPEETAMKFEVYIIKQAPLINWMQTFPTEDMKNDHVDGYCICKALAQRNGK